MILHNNLSGSKEQLFFEENYSDQKHHSLFELAFLKKQSVEVNNSLQKLFF